MLPSCAREKLKNINSLQTDGQQTTGDWKSFDSGDLKNHLIINEREQKYASVIIIIIKFIYTVKKMRVTYVKAV